MRLNIILILSLFTANLSLLPTVTTNKSLASVKKTVKKKQSSPKQFYKLLPLAGITATIATFLCWLGLRNPNPKEKDTGSKEKKKVRFAEGKPEIHVFKKDATPVGKDEPLVEKMNH